MRYKRVTLVDENVEIYQTADTHEEAKRMSVTCEYDHGYSLPCPICKQIQDLQAKLDNEKENFRVFNFDYEKMKSKLAAKDALLVETVKALEEIKSFGVCTHEHLSNCVGNTAETLIRKIQEARRG